MKKYFYYAFASAIALLGASGFTACSSADDLTEVEQPQVQEVVEDNPTYDPVTGLVKSQFVLNIASKAQTRSAANTVQAGGENFRGIDNTLLFAFKTNGKGFVDGTFAAAEAANRYDLGTVAAANSLDNDGNNSHRILELAMPTGTDAMLFYGKAIKGSATPDYNEIGKVDYSVTGKTATGFKFSLCQRADNATRFNYTAQVLAAIMTKIINAQGSYTVNMTTYPDWIGNATLSAAWKDVNPTTQVRVLSPLEEILFEAFTKLTTIGGTELRGGSSRAVITTINDLYTVTKKVEAAIPTSPYEELAKNLAENINTQINTYFATTAEVVTALKSVSNIKTSMAGDWNSSWDAVVNEELADFPVVNFTLPEGAAQLQYASAENTFSQKTPGVSLLDKSVTTDPATYQFPAELMYYCNSGVRTSNKEKTSSNGYPNGVANWDDNSKWDSDWNGTSVTSSTRATAMTKNVNYGVAMLKTTVGIKSGLSTINDNRHAINSEESDQVFNTSALDFTWTGVIIGSQPATVDWQFLPTNNTHDKLVYDNRVTGFAAGTAVPSTAGAVSANNYTIVFDNYSTAGTQEKVRVALQFVNNGDDFWGRDNLVRKGQTFYLVAELDPAGKSLTWDSYYQIPPLDGDGNSTKTVRVFIQDYMTTANFKIGENALKNAFVTLPDLRSSQLSFGLSVDLDWRPGIEFEAELGGN